MSTFATSPVDTVYIHMERAVSEPESVNTTALFNLDFAGLERLAAHTSLRKFEERVACAPREPATVALQWNMPTPITNVNLVRSRLFEDHYKKKLEQELRRVEKSLVEGSVESWNAVETRPSGDYYEGEMCWIIRSRSPRRIR
jgi:hypothetical protein